MIYKLKKAKGKYTHAELTKITSVEQKKLRCNLGIMKKNEAKKLVFVPQYSNYIVHIEDLEKFNIIEAYKKQAE